MQILQFSGSGLNFLSFFFCVYYVEWSITYSQTGDWHCGIYSCVIHYEIMPKILFSFKSIYALFYAYDETWSRFATVVRIVCHLHVMHRYLDLRSHGYASNVHEIGNTRISIWQTRKKRYLIRVIWISSHPTECNVAAVSTLFANIILTFTSSHWVQCDTAVWMCACRVCTQRVRI